MTRIISIAALIALAGCLKPRATPPGPMNFHSARSPFDATKVAAVALANAGFAVAQSDSVSTELTGTRTATRNGNQDFVSCDLPSGSDAAANRQTALSVSFKATAAGSGSDVRITSRVITTYPGYEGTSMQVPPNADNCVSNGTIEQQLANALR